MWEHPKIILKSQKLLDLFPDDADNLILVSGFNTTDGAITTPERFGAFTESLCHLDPNGDIMCYHELIGTRNDIEIITK